MTNNIARNWNPKVVAWDDASSSGAITKFPKLGRSMVFDVPSLWLKTSKDRLEELVSKLSPNWDGYGGVPVNFLNAHFALQVLDTVCLDTTPAPSIVPGSNGDLQLEWHTEVLDIELHVLAPNQVALTVVETASDGTEIETNLELTNDFSQVATQVRRLSEGAIAAQFAAA